MGPYVYATVRASKRNLRIRCNVSVLADVLMYDVRENDKGDVMKSSNFETSEGSHEGLVLDRRSFLRAGAAVIGGMAVLPLAACGSQSGTATSGSAASGSAASGSAEKTASEAFRDGGIWFERWGTESDKGMPIAKDDSVSSVLVFKDGKVTYYRLRIQQILFGDLNGLSDDEIIAKAGDIDKSNFESDVERNLEESRIQLSEEQDGKNDQAVVEDYKKDIEMLENAEYQEPEPVAYELAIETDASGNTAVSETLSFTCDQPEYNSYWGTELERSNDELYQPDKESFDFTTGVDAQTVYDTEFVGYSTLVTIGRDGDNTAYVLDTPDTEGIEVD